MDKFVHLIQSVAISSETSSSTHATKETNVKKGTSNHDKTVHSAPKTKPSYYKDYGVAPSKTGKL